MHIKITKIFSLEMAHALLEHDGPCKNIHGHSYRLEITVSGEPKNEPGHPKDGMVMDFADLKKIVNEKIIERFDHALVLNIRSPQNKIEGFEEYFGKIIFTVYQPTCENLLLDMKAKIEMNLPSNVKLSRVVLRETESSFAEWEANSA